MTLQRMVNDSVHWFMSDLTSRIVAETGISTDRHHLGKIILQSLKDAPDFVLQIDGATGESETFGSVLERTVRCANRFRNLGLGLGDVMILMSPCHVDVTIPLYAALYLGIIVAPVFSLLATKSLQKFFELSKAKIIFCHSDREADVQMISKNLDLDVQMVFFDDGDCLTKGPRSFKNFIEKSVDDTPVEDFKCADFDPEKATAYIIETSGTTGLPKAVAQTHKNVAIFMPYIWSRFSSFPTPTRLALHSAPLDWSSAIMSFIRSPILRYTRLQTSQIMTQQHAYDLINKYKPTYSIFTPTMMAILLRPDDRHKCDFTSLEYLMLTGNTVPQELIEEFKIISPNTEVLNTFAMSELGGLVFHGDNPAPGSCGKPMGCFQYRIINIKTQEDIYEPNVSGELWVKGPSSLGWIALGYYNNIEATKEAHTTDGWLKTGDIFYRDENWNFFFVDRIKLRMMGQKMEISPFVIESVIRQHPGVLDVVVTSIPAAELYDLPVALVVLLPGAKPSAQEIKELVKDSLTDDEHLKGGVIFIDALPMTTNTKVDRRKCKEMASDLPKE